MPQRAGRGLNALAMSSPTLTCFGADDGRATDLGGELSTTGWGAKRSPDQFAEGVGAKEVDCNPFNTTPMTSPCQGYDAFASILLKWPRPLGGPRSETRRRTKPEPSIVSTTFLIEG